MDKDVGRHGYKKNNDIDDKGIKDRLIGRTPEEVALRMKQLLEGIQEESLNKKMFLMLHSNAIMERLHTEMKNLRRSNAIDSLHPNKYFKAMTDITSKSIRLSRLFIKIYIEKKQKNKKN